MKQNFDDQIFILQLIKILLHYFLICWFLHDVVIKMKRFRFGAKFNDLIRLVPQKCRLNYILMLF